MSHVQMATVEIANMDTRDELKQEITIYMALSPHPERKASKRMANWLIAPESGDDIDQFSTCRPINSVKCSLIGQTSEIGCAVNHPKSRQANHMFIIMCSLGFGIYWPPTAVINNSKVIPDAHFLRS